MLFQVWRVCGSSFFALGAKCVAKSPIFGMKNWVRECWQTTMKCQIQWLRVRWDDHWKLASDPNTWSTWTSKLPSEEQFLLTSDHMQLGASSVTYLATSLVGKRNITYPSWSSCMHWQERCKVLQNLVMDISSLPEPRTLEPIQARNTTWIEVAPNEHCLRLVFNREHCEKHATMTRVMTDSVLSQGSLWP